MKIANDMKIVKEVKRKDGSWRFAFCRSAVNTLLYYISFEIWVVKYIDHRWSIQIPKGQNRDHLVGQLTNYPGKRGPTRWSSLRGQVFALSAFDQDQFSPFYTIRPRSWPEQMIIFMIPVELSLNLEFSTNKFSYEQRMNRWVNQWGLESI